MKTHGRHLLTDPQLLSDQPSSSSLLHSNQMTRSNKKESAVEKVLRLQEKEDQRLDEEMARELAAAQAKVNATHNEVAESDEHDDPIVPVGKRKRTSSDASQVSEAAESQPDINSNKCTRCDKKDIECIPIKGFACETCRKNRQKCSQTPKKLQRSGRGRKAARTAESFSASIPSANTDPTLNRSVSPGSDANISHVIRDVCEQITDAVTESVGYTSSSRFLHTVSISLRGVDHRLQQNRTVFEDSHSSFVSSLRDIGKDLATLRSDLNDFMDRPIAPQARRSSNPSDASSASSARISITEEAGATTTARQVSVPASDNVLLPFSPLHFQSQSDSVNPIAADSANESTGLIEKVYDDSLDAEGEDEE